MPLADDFSAIRDGIRKLEAANPLTRRNFAASLFEAPAIVKAGHIMPVKAWQHLDAPISDEAALGQPLYELLEPFFDNQSVYHEAGKVIRWDGIPNDKMRALNPPAERALAEYLKNLPLDRGPYWESWYRRPDVHRPTLTPVSRIIRA